MTRPATPAVPDLGAETVDLGVIGEEVLLRAGRPCAVPSATWTPGLARLAPAQQERILARSDAELRGRGWLDADGLPDGPLALVASVVTQATTIVTFETEMPGGATDPARGAFIVAPAGVVLAVHMPGARAYAVQVMPPGLAIATLALGLDPFDLAAATPSLEPPVEVDAFRLPDVVPPDERRSTVRLARVATGPGEAGEVIVTVVAQADGVLLCGARPAGVVRVQRLARTDLVDLAAVLLDEQVISEVAS